MNHPAAPLQSLTDKLIATKDGAIGWITFNNPERHNATSYEMWLALPVVLDAYVNDPDVRVIVLKGAGEKAFSAGADISQFKEKRTGPEAVKRGIELARKVRARLTALHVLPAFKLLVDECVPPPTPAMILLSAE